ncbi:hypothetical protein D9M70_622470 [compost metagenome]
MVSRPAGYCGDGPVKTESAEVEFIDEYIDHSHRIGVCHVVVQVLGQQCALASTLTLDETLHGPPPL